MGVNVAREIRPRQWAVGLPTLDDFELAERELPAPGAGEVQVRNSWMSVEPYMRGRMKPARSYVAPFKIGEPMEGHAVGVVTQSNAPALRPGDQVLSRLGWREAFNAAPERLTLLPATNRPELYMGVLGIPGFAAWIGLRTIIGLGPDDTVFISGAGGGVGITACELALETGARVIASVGSPEKVAYLKDAGVQQVFNYKETPNLREALRQAAPEGIDAYFDNVGGPHLEAALAAMRLHGRVALCGMISQYNQTEMTGPKTLIQAIGKRLTLRGFIVDDHMEQWPEFMAAMRGLVARGRVSTPQTVTYGLASAPGALLDLFTASPVGKVLIKL
jgi:NADPH-dependent curcumin reductase CurA